MGALSIVTYIRFFDDHTDIWRSQSLKKMVDVIEIVEACKQSWLCKIGILFVPFIISNQMNLSNEEDIQLDRSKGLNHPRQLSDPV